MHNQSPSGSRVRKSSCRLGSMANVDPPRARKWIRKQLIKTNGWLPAAALRLKVSMSALQKLVKKLDMVEEVKTIRAEFKDRFRLPPREEEK